MVEMKVEGLTLDPLTNMPIIILKDSTGAKALPIWVGYFEANAIALEIENISTPCPMTHDLLTAIFEELEVHVKAVVVTNLSEGTYYAGIRIDLDGEDETEVDSRPSDAIAVALRLGAPIFVDEEVMSEAGVEDDEQSGVSFEELVHGHDNNRRKILEEKLQKAVEDEEYERAAEIRDELGAIERKTPSV